MYKVSRTFLDTLYMIRDTIFFVLAHNIRSLHNVGSIFRTSDVFAVDKLFLSGYTGHPPDSKLEKVSLGADKTVPWEYSKSPVRLIKKLRLQYPKLTIVGLENNLFTTFAPGVIPALSRSPDGWNSLPSSSGRNLDSHSTDESGYRLKGGYDIDERLVLLPKFKAKFPLLLVLGEEVSGIPKNLLGLCDQFLEIPQFGTKESLNVSVAFGIAACAIRNN